MVTTRALNFCYVNYNIFFFKQKTAYEIASCLVGLGDVYKRQGYRITLNKRPGRLLNFSVFRSAGRLLKKLHQLK